MQVLDKGYIVLVDKMGDDLTPARAARTSFGDGSKGYEKDKKLIQYLMEHGHTSPFEMVEAVFEVKAPIFVARQWMRYRTANVNEFSMRYAEADKISDEVKEIDIYMPDYKNDGWRKQAPKNKQSSVPGFTDFEAGNLYGNYHDMVKRVKDYYRWLLERGVSREQARMILPLGTYTKFVWKNDLHNIFHFIEQRTYKDAQWEIQQYALAMLEILRLEFPLLIECWEEERRSKVTIRK